MATEPKTEQASAPKELYFFPELGISVEAASYEEAKKLTEQKK